MTVLAFDTYSAIKKLKEAGFTAQQAEGRLLGHVAVGLRYANPTYGFCDIKYRTGQDEGDQ